MNSIRSSAMRATSVAVLSLALASGAWAADTAKHESPQQLVDAMHSAFGDHHVRAVHAKGTILEGSFTPASTAQGLSEASLFSGGAIPVTVRFSDFTGIPDIPDTADGANPRGFALKFHLAGGATTDIVTHSFNGFPTANADEFAVLLRSIGASGPGAAKPTALDQFLGTHPVAKTFLTTQKPAPVSYATLAYFGVNAFKFTAANGKTEYVRYRLVPAAGEHSVTPAELKAKGPDYLQQEIATRVLKAPVRFDWYAQLSGKGDVIDNPSVAWPESRKLVKLGTITITKVAADQPKLSKETLFLPENLPKGIEAADPMLDLRNAAYPLSFQHRQ